MATELVPQAADELPRPDDTIQEDAAPKRKASPVDEVSSSKRQRQDDDHSPPHRRPSVPDTAQDRRASATQEEKKRGKRLFGGLLNTLSQTSTNSQHKRRQEIERKQQERLQKEREEDDHKRAEKMARIKEARMVDQIGFEEQVMRNRHSKLLALAELLKTKTQPAIYYLPWKRTADQEDVIDDQVRTARATIAREEDEFKTKKERHMNRYRPRRLSYDDGMVPAEPEVEVAAEVDAQVGKKSDEQREPEIVSKESEKPAHHDDAHDESGDVLVEADEDMVIY